MKSLTVLGILLGVGAIFLGNLLEGGHIASLFQFTAGLIVVGGTLGATLASHRSENIRMALKAFRSTIFSNETEERRRVAEEITQSALLARKESILALEKKVNEFSDPFMRSVFRFVVDGVDPETVRKVFESEIELHESRKMMAAKVWLDAGGFSPTIGIIGAVLGLIHIMGNLSDTSVLGQGIAVAFVATIYGVGLANLVLLPVGNKLKSLVQYRSETEDMILEGGLAILSGLNPYIIEQKMQAYLQ
ncbi:flagellar motor protein [bacterium]|nr:flagellar motor protein [bacterium]